MNYNNFFLILKRYFRKVFSVPWIFIFGAELFLSFLTIFIHFQTIALDKNIDILNKDKIIVYNLNQICVLTFILIIINFSASFWLEKTNLRYKYIFFNLSSFLVLIFGVLTIIKYSSL